MGALTPAGLAIGEPNGIKKKGLPTSDYIGQGGPYPSRMEKDSSPKQSKHAGSQRRGVHTLKGAQRVELTGKGELRGRFRGKSSNSIRMEKGCGESVANTKAGGAVQQKANARGPARGTRARKAKEISQ